MAPNALVTRYQTLGYTIGACTGPPTTVMCYVSGPITRTYVVPLSSVALYQSQYGMTLGECVPSTTTAMCAPFQAGTVLAPNALVPRYQAANYTLGQCTMHPTTPMCTVPPYLPIRTIIAANAAVPVYQNAYGFTVGECP